MGLDVVQENSVAAVKLDSPVTEPKPSEFKEAVVKDIQEFISTLKAKNLFKDLQELQKQSIIRSGGTMLIDWILIFSSWYVVAFVSIYFLPLSLLIMGNRQRALGNLLHDAGHSSLDGKKWRNDFIANIALSWPLFNLTTRYWHLHRTHHLYLGSMSDDPDYIHKDTFRQSTWQKVLSINLFSWPMFRSNAFGQIFDIPWAEKIKMLLWWLVVLSIMAFITGIIPTAIFAGLWMLSRMTVFHFITTFREISDHVGLIPGTLIGFTRNNPTNSIARIFFHPHKNGYHLTHHLAQRVPFFALPKAHELFMNCSQYVEGHHCDGYFFGEHTVVDCWTGKCQKEKEAEAA
jgi:fatty acid desaturase